MLIQRLVGIWIFFFVASDFIVHKERACLDLNHIYFLKSNF
jgi:hypothetical protein